MLLLGLRENETSATVGALEVGVAFAACAGAIARARVLRPDRLADFMTSQMSRLFPALLRVALKALSFELLGLDSPMSVSLGSGTVNLMPPLVFFIRALRLDLPELGLGRRRCFKHCALYTDSRRRVRNLCSMAAVLDYSPENLAAIDGIFRCCCFGPFFDEALLLPLVGALGLMDPARPTS